jgi:hypothetical protein
MATDSEETQAPLGGKSDGDEKLLEQIREDFRYVKSYWNDNYEEAAKDMQIVACIPPTEFEEDRKGRPCIWPDETSQYVKQANNNLRQNKRSIKISPRSEDATDKDAEHRQAYIRGIEYASKAQSVYTTGYESATECGFGFWRVTTCITGPKGEQEPRLRRIPNQFTVYLDPDAREADFSDGNIAFVLDRMRQKTFARKYKKAKKRSFTGADVELAPDWFSGEDIIVAEYWFREEIEDKDGQTHHKVTQYITNGVEILETNEWIGSWIPIIGVVGEEIYVKHGGESKRMFLSLIRRARAPQTMLAYIASQEAQEFSMAPQAPFLVIKGSVDPDEWKDAHRIPKAYLEYAIPQDWNAQMGEVPVPSRPQFQPNAQAYEMARESWRRAIQAAMGITPLPTAAQRQSEKSGIALEKIQDQEATGSYHTTDNYVRALGNTGRQLDELITKLAELDSLPKRVLGKNQKDEDVALNVAPRTQTPAPPQPIPGGVAAGSPAPASPSEVQPGAQSAYPLPADSEHLQEADQFFAHRGKFDVTVSDGASRDSEREEQSEFADTIFKTVTEIAQVLPPGAVAKILALAVKMKNIGAIGDEMHDILDQKDNTVQQLQQAQQQIAAALQAAQEMQAELQKLKLERAGKVIENEYKTHIEGMRLSVEGQIAQLQADLKAYVANVTTKAQSSSERDRLFQETQIENHHAAHDIAKQKDQQQHEKEQAATAAATQAASQAADQQHQQTMAQQTSPEESSQ